MKNQSLFLATLAMVLLASPATLAQTDAQKASDAAKDAIAKEKYNLGVAAYQKKDYKGATKLFWDSIVAGNIDPMVFLYRAHAFAAANDRDEAIKAYGETVQLYPGTPQAAMATQCMARWKATPPASVKSDANAGAAAAPAAKAPAAANTKQAVVKTAATGSTGRIVVAPPGPAGGFPEAGKQVIENTIARFPAKMRTIIEARGIKFYLIPYESPKRAGQGLPASDGSNIFINENESPRTAEDLKGNLIRETARAIDYHMGSVDRDKQFKAMYENDVREMPESVIFSMQNMVDGSDVSCKNLMAELVTAYMGGEHQAVIWENFPRTRSYIKQKFGF